MSDQQNQWRDAGLAARLYLADDEAPEAICVTPATIVAEAQPYSRNGGPNDQGLYCLIWDGQIVYVGLSRYIGSRLLQHHEQGRPFTHYWCLLGFSEGALSATEAAYIRAWEPAWNDKFHPGAPAAVVAALKAMDRSVVARLKCIRQPPRGALLFPWESHVWQVRRGYIDVHGDELPAFSELLAEDNREASAYVESLSDKLG